MKVSNIFLLIAFIFLVSNVRLMCQDTTNNSQVLKYDTIHTLNKYNSSGDLIKKSEVLVGKVDKINTSTVEFTLKDANLHMEFQQTDIKRIILSTGQILNYNEDPKEQTKITDVAKQDNKIEQPKITIAKSDKDKNTNVNLKSTKTKQDIFPVTFGLDLGLNGYANTDAIHRIWTYSTDATPDSKDALGPLSILNLGLHGEYMILKLHMWLGFYGQFNMQSIDASYKTTSSGYYYWDGWEWIYVPSTSTSFSRSLTATNITFGGSLAYIFYQDINKVSGTLQGYSELKLGSANFGLSRTATDVTVPKEEISASTLSTTIAVGFRMFSKSEQGFDVKLFFTFCNFTDIIWNGKSAYFLDGNKEKASVDFTNYGFSIGWIF